MNQAAKRILMKSSNNMDDKLRKAYFSGQLPDYLDKLLANGATEEDIKALEPELEKLQEERERVRQRVTTYEIKEDLALPGVDKLMTLSDAQKSALERWEEERRVDYQKAQQLFAQAKNGDTVGNKDFYLDLGFELVQIHYNMDHYQIWKEQLYHAMIIKIMDGYGCSRREAEDRSKLTHEYREYKKAKRMSERIDDIVLLCKKKASYM